MDSDKSVTAEFLSIDLHIGKDINGSFEVASLRGIKQIETQPAYQITTNLIQPELSNNVKHVEQKGTLITYIGLDDRFVDHGDGTVSDTRTGLMWARSAVGQHWNGVTCIGEATAITIKDARKIRSDFASHDDWRLPTIEELVALSSNNPGSYLDNLAFPNQSRHRYWSSTKPTQEFCNQYQIGSYEIGRQLIFSFFLGAVRYADYYGFEGARLVRSDRHFPIELSTKRGGGDTVAQSSHLDFYSFGSNSMLTAQASFSLNITVTGTGGGRVTRSIHAEAYFLGTVVTLTAQADEGSIFNGWYGDATGLDEVCSLTTNAPLSVNAEFEKLTISETFITIEMENVESLYVKNAHFDVFHIIIRNKGQQQVRVKVPLTNFLSHLGWASEQDSWLAGLANGSKDVTLAAGGFCRMGLVYMRCNVQRGDCLHVNIVLSQPLQEIFFSFKCIDSDRNFILVNSYLEVKDQPADALAPLPEMTKLLKRIESLEASLSEVLGRLDAIQRDTPRKVETLVLHQPSPVPTLIDVLKWLALQNRIEVVELRARLLPLDLLPGAVINEVNERALDLSGELALEETGNEIVVGKAAFDAVLAQWDSDSF